MDHSTRASMYNGYLDCARMSAAKQFPDLFESKGFELRRLKVSIGAAAGTSFHAAAADILRQKTEVDANKSALEHLDLEIEKTQGAQFDDTTPDRKTALVQIDRMVKAWLPLGRTFEPQDVELELRADIGNGFLATGHLDLLDRRGIITDWKTGSKMPSAQPQLGQYARLAVHNGKQVNGVGMVYVPRVKVSAVQPSPIPKVYDLAQAMNLAYETELAIKRDVSRFVETGDISAFLPNPASMLCSPKYCPAHGTSACSFGK